MAKVRRKQWAFKMPNGMRIVTSARTQIGAVLKMSLPLRKEVLKHATNSF